MIDIVTGWAYPSDTSTPKKETPHCRIPNH